MVEKLHCVALKGQFTQNYNITHLLLTPMPVKTLVTFSDLHNHP